MTRVTRALRDVLIRKAARTAHWRTVLGGHQAVVGAKRGRCRRLTRWSVTLGASCAPDSRSVSGRPASPRRISRARGATTASRREWPKAGWTGHAAAGTASASNQPSKQGTVQVSQVVIAQIPHRLPQVLLRGGAENLCTGSLCLGPFRAEQDATAPHAILGAAKGESDVYGLSVEADGRQVVDD